MASGIANAIQNAVTNVAVDIDVQASDPRVKIVNHTGVLNGQAAGATATFDIEFVGDGVPRRFDLQFVRAGTNVVLGSIPVVLGTPIPGDGYGFEDLDDGEIEDHSDFACTQSVTLPGDTNADGRVDLDDLNNVRNHFGESGSEVIGDTNHDDTVDLNDLNNVRNNFGATLSPAAMLAAPSPQVTSVLATRVAAKQTMRTDVHAVALEHVASEDLDSTVGSLVNDLIDHWRQPKSRRFGLRS